MLLSFIFRWSQLDAAQWGSGSENSGLETNFKICIDPSVLGKGHGSQPTYQALASSAAGSIPKYLKVPVQFPSVADLDPLDEEPLDLE